MYILDASDFMPRNPVFLAIFVSIIPKQAFVFSLILQVAFSGFSGKDQRGGVLFFVNLSFNQEKI